MNALLHPALYQVNARQWLAELAHARPASLDDVPQAELDRIAGLGMDWLWLQGVWQTGQRGRDVSRNHPEWRREFSQTLPDLHEEDIAGSGFAITAYRAADDLGGNESLARLRERLHSRGVRLMLDFVPNHTALDHSWVTQHPEFYLRGTDEAIRRDPQGYLRIDQSHGHIILAHGRDPNFPAWPDTLQLDYRSPATVQAMTEELAGIARHCDGARCDMAMLLLPEVFERTWGGRALPFWPGAIEKARACNAAFCFMAEVYWDLEWAMQQLGFDYTYDKKLYDRLRRGDAAAVRDHLQAGLEYQGKLVRFLENHDESRAAAVFTLEQHRAAALITFLSPGLRLFHHGQLEGRRKRISPHLNRGPNEPVDPVIRQFYQRLLDLLRQPLLRQGHWQPLCYLPAHDSPASVISFAWQNPSGTELVVSVNYGAHPSQGRVLLPPPGIDGRWTVQDFATTRELTPQQLHSREVHLDCAPWQITLMTQPCSERRGPPGAAH